MLCTLCVFRCVLMKVELIKSSSSYRNAALTDGSSDRKKERLRERKAAE